MISRTAASLAGVLGGASWIARFALDRAGSDLATGRLGVALHWAGAVWLALAALSAGAALVRASAWPMQIVAGGAAVALGVIGWSIATRAFPELSAEAAIGAGAIVLSGLLFVIAGRSQRRTAAARAG